MDHHGTRRPQLPARFLNFRAGWPAHLAVDWSRLGLVREARHRPIDYRTKSCFRIAAPWRDSNVERKAAPLVPIIESGIHRVAMENLTSTNHFLIALARVAGANGVGIDDLLSRSGIDPGFLKEPGMRVNTRRLATFVRLLSDEMKDETLGQCEFPSRPGTFFTLGELAVHQPNLLRAINRAIRFDNQVSDGYRLDLCVEGDTATFEIDQPRLDLDPDHLLTDLIMLAWHRFCSWLIGDNIVLAKAVFAFPPPPHVDEYRFLFPCPRAFDQSVSGFSFHRGYLNRPVIQTADTLKRFMQECPFKLFIRPEKDNSLSSRVQKIVREALDDRDLSLDKVAAKLGMSHRTLRRKLEREGTSYRMLKDAVRRDMAIHLLTQQSLSVREAAERLGFSEPGVFVRAFKAWAGVTPGVYKRLDTTAT